MVGGHDDAVAGSQPVGRAVDADLGLTVEDLHKGVEVSRVLSQALILVEGKEGDVAGAADGDLLTDDRAGGVVHRWLKGDDGCFLEGFHCCDRGLIVKQKWLANVCIRGVKDIFTEV